MTAFTPRMTGVAGAASCAPDGQRSRSIRTFFVLLWLFCPLTAVACWPFVALAHRLRAALMASVAMVTLVGALAWNPGTRDEAIATSRATVLAPLTAVAVAYGVAHGGSAHVAGGLVLVTGMESGHGPRAGFVVGNAFLTRRTVDDVNDALLSHETAHANQWAALGGWFPLAYFGSDWLHGAGSSNIFEISAGLEAGDYPGA